MEILIDFLTFTAPAKDLHYWKERLNLFEVKFVQGRPMHGWSTHDYFNGAHVLIDGRDDVCFDFSGIGCRFLETLHNNNFDWIELLEDIVNSEGTHISRLDVACDDRDEDKILNMQTLVSHCKKRKYISRARRSVWIDGAEQMIIFGSSTSNTRLRIYNKALERKVNEHWIRAEFQLRDESALSFILNLLDLRDIGSTYGGVLLNYLRFTTKPPDENNNNSRINTTPWWSKFVNTSQRIKNIKVGGLEYNYDSLENFIDKQCASSLKTYIAINKGDITPLLEKIEKAKLNIKQETLIDTMR